MPNSKPQPRQKRTAVAIDPAAYVAQFHLGSDSVPLLQAIEKKRGSRVLCLVYSETPFNMMLAPPSIRPLEEVLRPLGRVDKLDVFLRSTGGVAEVPWRIVSLLREFCDQLGVIVPRFALSGATHIAIAADDLVMTPFSVLGSVDPTRSHPLLPKDAGGNPIPTSVQDLRHLIQFVRNQLDASYPEQNLALIFSELFKYVDPLAIGALEQSYNLARLITQKVLGTRRTLLDKQAIDGIVDRLSGGYFSHAFPISRVEVESDLKLPVTRPDEELESLIHNLDHYYDATFSRVVSIGSGNQDTRVRPGGFIETTSAGWFIAVITSAQDELIADCWVPFRQGVQKQ